MSSISKQLIVFTSEIISDNYSLDSDDIITKLSSKENKEKIANFIKSNKIKQKKEKSVSNEPEKFKTAYNLFSKEYRKIITKENPGVSISEAASLLGKKWDDIKENSPSVYKKYVDQSNKLKEEYEEKMIQYRIDNNLPEKITKVSKPKKDNKGGDKKKAESAFHYFFHDHDAEVREDNPDMNKHGVYLLLRKRWNDLKDDKDEVFLKYKEVAKAEKKKLLSQTSDDDEVEEPSSPAPPSSPTPTPSPEQQPSTPVPSSPEEPSTPTPKKKKMKKKHNTPPGELSEAKYLSSPPIRSSLKKKKTKKVKKDDKKDKKKKKKIITVVDDSSSSESDSE